MRNKYLAAVSIFLFCIYCVIPTYQINEAEKEDITSEKNNIKIFDLDIEEYIIGVVAAEMPASFNIEALKAQSVASRSYAINLINNGLDLTTDTSTQAFITLEDMKQKWSNDYEHYYNIIKDAVYSTEGLVMEHNDEVITAFYFAISNGNTFEASDVFSNSLDYITSVESSWDVSVNNYEMTKTFTKEEFCSLLEINCEKLKISDITYNLTNQVDSITINEKIFKATKFREILSLRSTTFSIVIDDYIYITTKGYGHGVGMSQYGANAMANQGFNYEEILNYYYKNITIVNL